MYQLLISHDRHGAGEEYPFFDLGWFFEQEQAVQLAANIGAVSQVVLGGPVPEEWVVANVLDAWAHPHYRVWLLPDGEGLPVLEYRDSEIVEVEEDPRG